MIPETIDEVGMLQGRQSQVNVWPISLEAEFVQQRAIVAATSLGMSDPLLTNQQFDVCVIDEASQMTEPVQTWIGVPTRNSCETVTDMLGAREIC